MTAEEEIWGRRCSRPPRRCGVKLVAAARLNPFDFTAQPFTVDQEWSPRITLA